MAAFQEFARTQRVAFDRLAGGTYAAYPGTLGRSLDAENSIVWRTDTFDLVKGETRPYPYFRGAIRNMPRVLLRHKQTGAEFWVTSYHNPATCCGYGDAAGYRTRAVSEQARDANALVALTKTPLIVAGDMNDRSTYFCAHGQQGTDALRRRKHVRRRLPDGRPCLDRLDPRHQGRRVLGLPARPQRVRALPPPTTRSWWRR